MPLPENDYHFNTIDCTTKNSQIYKLGDIQNSINNGLISSKTHNMTIDFATSIEGLKVKVIKGPNEKEEDENYFGIIRQKDNNGKDTIIVSKNIENAYLSVETPDILLNKTTNYSTDFDYMFKYTYKNKDPNKDPAGNQKVKYNNNITNKKMAGADLKTSITLDKIKDLNTNKQIPCNYYIRINKNNNKKRVDDTKNNYFYPKKNISILTNKDNDDIYAIYKIDSDNSILKNEKEDSFTIPIEIETNEPVYVDVVAESTTDGQIYGYRKVFPNSPDDYDSIDGNNKNNRGNDGKKEEKGKSGDDSGTNDEGTLIKYILVGICVLLLLIILIVCCVKTCNCCGKKAFHLKKKEKGLDDINNQTLDKENDNILDDTSF